MAQNITLLGASYADVPAVELPKTGGGTATFTDVTDTTAAAADVASGKYFYTAAGVKTAGTSSGGGGGGINTEPTIASGVIFIDYDGNIVEEWETSTVAGKTDLPSNPSHTGLTAQGWNWSLADIKTYVQNYSYTMLTVGQMYITSSGKTEIDVNLNADTLHPYLGIAPNGTVVVDWGDGSATTTLTGTSNTTTKWANHTYSATGDYTIKLTVSSGNFAFYGTNQSYGNVLQRSNSWGYDKQFSARVQAIRLGSNAKIAQYCFAGCFNMKYITIPSTVEFSGTYNFCNCYGFKGIVIPTGTTSIGANCFIYAYGLELMAIPNTVTSIGNYGIGNDYNVKYISVPQSTTSIGTTAFGGCTVVRLITIPSSITSVPGTFAQNNQLLARVTIPSTVTSIGASAFSGCRSLLKIRFNGTTPPNVSNSNAWSNIGTWCIISVPIGYKSTYTSKSNYPSSSTYTYIEEA